MAGKHSKGLIQLTEYPTYQAALQLHPQNGITADDLFIKTVLYATNGIRNRIKKEEGDASFLSAYPTPDRYMDFGAEDIRDITTKNSSNINVVYQASQHTWASRVIEPSGKDDGKTFITTVTISKSDGCILMSGRTTCQEPSNAQNTKEDVYRLGFISHDISADPDIIITEFGISDRFPLINGKKEINGKSKSECTDIYENLIADKNRQYPVILMTGSCLNNIEQYPEAYDKLLYACKFVSYVLVVNGSVNKIVLSLMHDAETAGILSKDRSCVLFPGAGTEEASRIYEIFDEDLEIKYSEFNSLCYDAQHYLRDKAFDYHETPFFTQVRSLALLDTLPDTGSSEQNEEIAAIIQSQQDEILSKENTINELRETIAGLKKSNADLERRNKKLSRQNLKMEKLENDLADERAKAKEAEASRPDIHEVIARSGDELREYRKIVMPFFDVPIKDARSLLKWIDKYYSDLIIVHKRAEKELSGDSGFSDYSLLTRMIHYLYGYTLSLNQWQGDYNSAMENARKHDVLNEALEATNTGDAYIHHEKEYSIDISEYDPKEINSVILSKHIKKGNQEENMTRVYFYYDSRIGKSIIGSMPEHLPTEYK